jgi:2'-deoxynucleoside 5'-phosphate N-hydrolase
MMKAFLSIKFHENLSNRKIIEDISESLEKARFKTVVIARDYERWGQVKFEPDELMRLTFKLIDESDILVIEFSEKGVGLGIEAGYAYANKKPVVVVAKKGSDISGTLEGISDKLFFYDNSDELVEKFKGLKFED